jgi:sodium/hydrogen exchanger-like protein 3
VFIGVAAFFVVSLGGMMIGILWAYLTAFLSKFTDHVRGIELSKHIKSWPKFV